MRTLAKIYLTYAILLLNNNVLADQIEFPVFSYWTAEEGDISESKDENLQNKIYRKAIYEEKNKLNFEYKSAVKLELKHINKRKIIIWLFILSFTVYFSSNFLSEKIKGVHIINDLTTTNFSGQKFTALKARKAKAYCSIDLIKNNFWTGVGIGDGPSELLKYYKKNGFMHGVERKFNSHNQFLTTFIYLGIFGFLLLVFIISFLFYKYIKNGNIYLLSFLIITFCFFMTESVLEREKGIVFFAYFSLLFTCKNR